MQLSPIAGKNFSLLLCHFTLLPLSFATKEDNMFILFTHRPIIFFNHLSYMPHPLFTYGSSQLMNQTGLEEVVMT
jgi:hypothetical protein